MKQLKSGDWILALALTIVAYIYYDALSHSPRPLGEIFFPAGPEYQCKNPQQTISSWPFKSCDGSWK